MKVVARLESISELRRVSGVSDRPIEVEHAIKCAARADPLIYRLTRGFSIRAVVISTLVRRQCSPKYSDSVLMRPFDDLLQTHDEVLRADHLVNKRHLRGRSAVGQSWPHVRPADVVDALQHDQVNDPRLCQNISIEARQRADARTIVQNAISTDPLVKHGQPGSTLLARQTTCQNIRPVAVISLLRPYAIGNRIAKCHSRCRLI